MPAILTVLLLFVVGMCLSAFFSGSETGFYRATRARLVIHALEGDRISRILLWATNNPAVFVATALVGNNVANYVVSLAIVMGVSLVAPGQELAELLAPILLAPVIFIYGELLPKNVFFAAPNRLLRRCGPGLVVAAVVFAPVSAVLWLFSRLLELVGRQSPPELQAVIARRELAELLEEGHAVGILQPVQQTIAQATLTLAGQPIRSFMALASRYPRATTSMKPQDVVRLARRQRRNVLPVEESSGVRKLIGMVSATDCLLTKEDHLPIRPLPAFRETDTYLATLARMVADHSLLAQITNARGQAVGFVSLRGLQRAMMHDA